MKMVKHHKFGPLLDVALWILVILHLAKSNKTWGIPSNSKQTMASGRFREDLYYTALRYTRLHLHCTTLHDSYNVQSQLKTPLQHSTTTTTTSTTLCHTRLQLHYTTAKDFSHSNCLDSLYLQWGDIATTRSRQGHSNNAKHCACLKKVFFHWVSASFAWQACGTMCIAKGSDVCPGVPWVSASFAWQAWDNVHCQGVGCTGRCTPWRPLGSTSFAWQAWDNVLLCGTHSLTPHSLTDSLTHSFTHSLTCACTYIRKCSQTHPPSPLHHSYTSFSLLAFLCSV